MDPITQVILTVVATVLFGLMILFYCKSASNDKKATAAEKHSAEIVDITSFKERCYKNNLQMFLDADEALANKQDEKGMAMYMKAVSSARRFIANENSKEKRAS